MLGIMADNVPTTGQKHKTLFENVMAKDGQNKKRAVSFSAAFYVGMGIVKGT